MTDAELTALDARIAREWMGWHRSYEFSITHSEFWRDGKGLCRPLEDWHPTRNAAHAGEARRRADSSVLIHGCSEGGNSGCVATVTIGGHSHDDAVRYSETNNDAAEALAICLAIEAALNAREGV